MGQEGYAGIHLYAESGVALLLTQLFFWYVHLRFLHLFPFFFDTSWNLLTSPFVGDFQLYIFHLHLSPALVACTNALLLVFFFLLNTAICSNRLVSTEYKDTSWSLSDSSYQ
jgi:hypothetical protein